MSQNTVRASSLSFLFLLLLFIPAFGQKIHFQVQRATPSETAAYQEQFRDYTIATLDTKTVADLLRSKDQFDHLELEIGGQVFSFELEKHDLRSPDYRLTVQSDTGRYDLPRTRNTTYAGFTKQGHHKVRITADDNFFYGMIMQDGDEFYFEPATDIVPTASPDQYILFWGKDVSNKFTNNACAARRAPMQQFTTQDEHPAENQATGSRDLCKVVEIGIANDKSMFTKFGSVASVTSHVMGVINNVLTNYDTEFTTDLQFTVTQVFVVTGTDPWTNSTDPGNLLDDFTAWGPSNLAQHDQASLWTNRDFDSNTIGLAWIGGICNGVRYCVLQDFTSNAELLRCLQAHEMGHNFNADHDAANSGFIMAPAVSSSTTWSPASLAVINAYIPTRSCLSSCTGASAPIANFDADNTDGCVPFTVHFLDQSQNNPTSWLWTFPGGTPGTSTMQNPTVVYNSVGSYNVTLKATNAQGNNTVTKNNFITVNDDPVADFDYTQNGLNITFINLSTGATSYAWNFGDGDVSSQSNPTHAYDQDGVYNVKLTAFNDCGSTFITITITIITLPEAAFDADQTEGCIPMEVEFINESSFNADSYQWSFPGGSPPTSTAFEPTVIYETPGTYNVTLTVFNGAGQDVLTQTNFISVMAAPNSVFTSAVNGQQVVFNSSGSFGDSYSWNFGDGMTSTQHNPTHTYQNGGSYNVTLTITNPCGTDVQQSTVNVAGIPVAEFSSDVQSGCAPFVVHYLNESQGTLTSINWVFEGGTPATSTQTNPVVTYNNPGNFDVTLTVANGAGNDVLVRSNYITITGQTISDFDYDIIGHQVFFDNQSVLSTGSVWTFGDGDVSDDENPNHLYDEDGSYTVYLVSSGVCGPDTSSAVITISTTPTANFTYAQNGDCAPVTVQYVNSSSSNTTSVHWTFEGGSPATSSQNNPQVTYNTPGTYSTTLIAVSAAGSDTITLTQIIDVATPVDASFLINTNGLTVDMENQSSSADSYLWMFGDGDESAEENPSHTYNSFGTYTITLISTNDCGSDTATIEIVLSTVPNAFFSYDGHSGCVPMTVQFFDQSQNDPTSWLWTFTGGDPETSTLQNPVVTYNVPGNYTVSLRVENSQGADVLVLMDLINVAGQPDATFDHTQNGNIVTLFYPGIDYDSLRWDFGDGRTDVSLNPTVEYDSSGTYTVSLIIFNACGSDTASVNINIEGNATNDPLANISKWQIRPNPFSNTLTLYGEPVQEGFTKVTLWDIHGKLIAAKDWNHGVGASTLTLDANTWPSGMILVHLQDELSPVMLKAIHQ